jgi:hypothetical protein
MSARTQSVLAFSPRKGRVIGTFVVVASLVAAIGLGHLLWERRQAQLPTPIFQGVSYRAERIASGEEGGGLLHVVTVDLAAPGLELYATPLDPEAVAQGWQYRLRRIADVVEKEHLAVAINGVFFSSSSPWWFRMSGDLAKGGETVVADHVVSHISAHTYLLWFDEQLKPHLPASRPPRPTDLAQAKWGIGGLEVGLRDGKVSLASGSEVKMDSRTAVAVDRERKLLFLAVAENMSPRLMLQKLALLGAKDGMLLDGGSSSAMAIGKHARGISPGVVHGGWRPVATHFGVRVRAVAVEVR